MPVSLLLQQQQQQERQQQQQPSYAGVSINPSDLGEDALGKMTINSSRRRRPQRPQQQCSGSNRANKIVIKRW